MSMSDEARDRQRIRNQERPVKCVRCAGMSTRTVDGATLEPSSHFAGVLYKVCGGCGHEQIVRQRRRRRGL